MTDGNRVHPVELVRNLIVALERLSAEAARADREPGDRARVLAEAAVRGATDELKTHLPPLDEVLDPLVGVAAASAVRGALGELRTQMPRVPALLEALNVQLLEALEQRTRQTRQPGARARAATIGAVHGAVTELHRSLPQLTADLRALGPAGEELALVLGRGLSSGLGLEDGRLATAMGDVVDAASRRFIAALADQLRQELARMQPHRPDALRRLLAEAVGGVWDAVADRARGPALATAAGLGVLLGLRWRSATR